MSTDVPAIEKVGCFYAVIRRGNLPSIPMPGINGEVMPSAGIPICPRHNESEVHPLDPTNFLNPRKVIRPTKEQMQQTKLIMCTGLVPKMPEGQLPKVPRLAVEPQWHKDLKNPPKPKKYRIKKGYVPPPPLQIPPFKPQGMVTVPYL